MSKTESNLQVSEAFIQSVLKKHFNQHVDPDALRSAAGKLCEALPELCGEDA